MEAPDVPDALTLIGVDPGLDPDERRARIAADEAWATMLQTEPSQTAPHELDDAALQLEAHLAVERGQASFRSASAVGVVVLSCRMPPP